MASPGSRPYKAHGAALDLWSDRRPEVILSGPAGTGKSRACLEKLHACCLKWPGCRWLIVRKTRESLTESGLVTFESKVLPENSPICEGPQRRMRQAYHYPNGSEVVVGGLDKPSKVMSTEYDGIYVQEAIELFENDFESLTTRLRNGVMPFQQIIGDTNPDGPMHWLKRRADAGRLHMVESRHEDNPTIWDAKTGQYTRTGAEYISKLESLTGVRYHRLRHGRWVAAEGLVYEDWDRAIHWIDDARDHYPRYVAGVDWGYTNPGVIQVWGVDHDGRMTLVHEIYRTQRLIGWWTEQARILRSRYSIEVFVCDPAEPAFIEQFRSAKLPVMSAYNDIKMGIQVMQARIKPAGDARPRLVISRASLADRDESLVEAKLPTCLIEEIDGYSWPKGIDGRAVKEIPVDKDNHGRDVARYVACYLDGMPPQASKKISFGVNPLAGYRG